MNNSTSINTLVIIDPQNDFVEEWGTLRVPGADADVQRITKMLRAVGPAIDEVVVTMDLHHMDHISHRLHWHDANGDHPEAFSTITLADVESGLWTSADPDWARHYLRCLEKQGQTHTIWPYHCLLGDEGSNIQADLFVALSEWNAERDDLNIYTKGLNRRVEQYSAIQSAVPDPHDPATWMRNGLVSRLERPHATIWCGQAGSHCVRSTAMDAVDNFNDPEAAHHQIFLTDAMSPVAGFEDQQARFLQEMADRGAVLMKVAELTNVLG